MCIATASITKSQIFAAELISECSPITSKMENNKRVRFDMKASSIQEVPSSKDYHAVQLQQMYYQKTDYDSFRRTYAKQSGMEKRAKSFAKTKTWSPPRSTRKSINLPSSAS